MLFETLIRWLGQFERHLTKTDSFISVSNKLTLNLFINTSVVLYIATATHSENYWGRGGLLENTGWLFMSNFVLVRLLSLFNPAHYYRKYQRSKLEADATYMNLIQSEANESSITLTALTRAGCSKTNLSMWPQDMQII
eukprot:TRINITY_DN3218_c0_g2_i7.p1 TRINITY_DN3218_c0_g2~~TRINITY_DN3218_c0_g2_i7.p1  ORF type:complete len:139 (+),score=14.80 TRINITY_DN3218_c0_g2_i7:175-591(+)